MNTISRASHHLRNYYRLFLKKETIHYTLMVSLCLFISGCFTVKYSLSGASIPEEAKTISIQYFSSSVPAPPSLSQSFTEALKDIMTTRSRLVLVSKGGDVQFEGNITGYQITQAALQSNETAALNRLTISVNVKYVCKFDEKKNFEASFSRFSDFPGTQNLAEVETELTRAINKQLSEDIFNKAFNNW